MSSQEALSVPGPDARSVCPGCDCCTVSDACSIAICYACCADDATCNACPDAAPKPNCCDPDRCTVGICGPDCCAHCESNYYSGA